MKTVLSVVALAAAAGTLQADIVTAGGAAVVVTPPADISNGQWTSNSQVRCWAEQQLTLGSSLALDHITSGMVTEASQLVPGTLSASSIVQSYMVRADAATTDEQVFNGYLVFDTPIWGVMVSRPLLNGSDALLGRTGTLYNTNSYRGLELSGTALPDWFQISADHFRIDFHMILLNNGTDDIRIITVAPAPSSAAVVALAGLARCRRRR